LPNEPSSATIRSFKTIPDDAEPETKQQSAQAIQKQELWA
jgi:hypothetical protein